MFHRKVYMSVTCFNKYTQMGWQRQKTGLYTPCWEHTVDWAHNWERKQISWPGPVCVLGAGGGSDRDRKQTPISNYCKLFSWMTDFISDQKKKWGEKIRAGGLMEDNEGEQVESYSWETRVTSTALAHI